jgi:cell division protein FtsQ
LNDDEKIYAERRFTSPRIVNKQTEKKHWLRHWLLGLLLIGLLAGGWRKATDPAVLPIRHIKIEGVIAHINRTAVQQTVSSFLPTGFLRVNAAALQERLQQLPWVYAVSVRRVWPDTLAVSLVEQKPLARFNNTAVLNQYGELFNVAAAEMPAQLPLLIASPGQEGLTWQMYQKLSAILTPLALKITILEWDARQSWRLQLSNGIVLLLGKVDPEQRLQRLAAVYPQIVGAKANQISYLDLRYPHGIAAGFKH